MGFETPAVTVYILFIWLAGMAHPEARVVLHGYGDCQRRASLVNEGRPQPVAYCVESKLE